MNAKTTLLVAGLVFGIIALMHILRIVYSWEVVFNGTMVPMTASYVGVVVAGLLSYFALKNVR